MINRDYKVFIVEGEAREPLIIKNISNVFFSDENIKIITLPAGQNIYMLWKKLKADNFETSIIEVLREDNREIAEQLDGLGRDDFSEVFLFFDYDGHQKNLGEESTSDVLKQMLTSFDNETENGKLYISYPMVEALRDFNEGKCGIAKSCFVSFEELTNYKFISAERSENISMKAYDFTVWEKIIEVFAMRISCLMGLEEVLAYETYINKVSPYGIYRLEENEIVQQRVFILSAFPEFLIDYFGERLWKSCVRSVRGFAKVREKCCIPEQ